MGYWETQAYWYRQDTGRYTSTALLSSLPYWYDLTAFRLVALLDLLLIPLAARWFLRSLLPGPSATTLAALVLALYLHQLSNLYDSLLRFTCMPIYHAGLIGTLLFAGLLIRLLQSPQLKISWLFGLLVLGAFTIGTNEISLVQVLAIGLGSLSLFFIRGERPPVYLWVIGAVLLLFAAVAVCAPGNFVRLEDYESGGRLLPAAGNALGVSLYLWVSWLADSLLLPAGLLWGLLLVSKRITLGNASAFGRPLYWVAGLLILTPLSLFPLLYGTGGSSLAERIVDLIFFMNAVLWFGWISASYQTYGQLLSIDRRLFRLIALPLALFITFHLFADGLSINRETPRAETDFLDLITVDANIGKAWLQLIDGTAARYAQEMEAIGQRVEECRTDTCRVPALQTTDFIGYDPLYDRLQRGGDSRMGKALGNERVEVVVD